MGDPDRSRAEIARLAGIADATTDAFGRRNAVPIETRDAILAGLGLLVATEADIAASLERLRELRHGLVPKLLPTEAGAPFLVPLRGVTAEVASWRVTDEAGTVREGRAPVESLHGAPHIRLDLPGRGYFTLAVEAGGLSGSATVIAALPLCYRNPALADGARLWGLSAQLVSVRSDSDLGIGDFGSVAEAATRFAPYGASFLGLSPLHALFPTDRSKIAPYGPSSRLFLDPIHIDVTAFATSEETAAAAALRSAPLADHAGVWELKRPILERAFARFAAASPPPDFLSFRSAGGVALLAHATFEALSEHFVEGGTGWTSWPAAFRDPNSAETLHFRVREAPRVTFHAWLQWLADTQLRAAADAAKAAGMEIGLYGDLAVGADPGGSEAWTSPDRYAQSLSVGAPPDPLAPQGQDWGIVPLNPIALEETGLAGFRALVAANLRHVGALRIDHAFQLQRLYLVPRGEAELPGAFVDYPFDALLAAVRLESHRAECMVIGEDLGTAPPGFSDRMMASGALSYRVLLFERHDHGAFKPPPAYPERAIAVFTTHDLPTIVGWWAGRDIDWRQKLGLLDEEASARASAERAEDRRRLMEALQREGFVTVADPPAEPPLAEIVRYLARTRSALAALQLEDVVGEVEQANLPGVVNGHPNWRRRLTLDLAAIAAPEGPLAPLAKVFASERPAARRAR